MIRALATTLRFGLIRFLQYRCRRAHSRRNNKRLSWMFARAACSRPTAFAALLKTNADTSDITAEALAGAAAPTTRKAFGAGSWGRLGCPICEVTVTAKRRGASLTR